MLYLSAVNRAARAEGAASFRFHGVLQEGDFFHEHAAVNCIVSKTAYVFRAVRLLRLTIRHNVQSEGIGTSAVLALK